MINLEETLKIIEEEGSLEKSTKELKEAGLNDYYIRKAIESGALAHISHGKYKMLNVEKEILRRQSFNNFMKEVFKNNFEEAYTHLVKNLENQSNHDYDYNLKLYFLLLKEILKDQKDFSFLDDILIFSDRARNSSYYDHLINFKEAVLCGEFDDAYQSIVLFKDAEKENKGTNHLSSILFYRLTSHICFNNRKRKCIAKMQKEEREREHNYVNYYEKIKSSIENDNYEEALENLEKIFPYTKSNKKSNIQKMTNLIEKYLEIKASKETLPVLNIDYSTYQDNFNSLLNAALNKGDYETAYKTIGKCLYYAPQSTTLQLYRKLLYTLIDQNKENKKLTLQVKEKSIPVESPKIDIEVLTQLIYDRKYQQVKELIEDEKDERLYRLINQMLKKIESLSIGNNQIAMEHTYRSAEYRVFNRFFEALSCRDYQEAYILVEKCLEISEYYNNDTSELTIYGYLLEDIVELEKNFDEQKKQKQEIKRLRESKREILHQKEITEENFQSLKYITTKLISLSSGEELTSNIHMQHMLDTLESIDESYLDRDSFAEFEYAEESILEKFLKAISLGDYITAHQLTKDKKWYEENQKSPNRLDNLMYRKLLHFMSDKLDTPQEKSFTQENTADDTIDYSTIDHLKKLKTLLKHRKFTEALEYYQENEFGDISSNLNTELEVFLHLLGQPIKREDKELNEKFISSYKSGNLEQAQEDLDNYHKFIEENNITRNIDYYDLRLISLEKEKITPDFQEKEDLYNQAVDCFQKQNYIEACEKLNSYIEKDNDLSAKGYLLRGQCLENLAKFPAAEENYKMAISIIPEPNAYHQLGKLYYYYQGNYQAAVDCFLEYEKRKPKCYQNNLESLSASYQELGEEKLSIKYKTLAKNLSTKISNK